jgi:hypothetical protein
LSPGCPRLVTSVTCSFTALLLANALSPPWVVLLSPLCHQCCHRGTLSLKSLSVLTPDAITIDTHTYSRIPQNCVGSHGMCVCCHMKCECVAHSHWSAHQTQILRMQATASILWLNNTFVELPARRMKGSAHSHPPYEDGSSTNVLFGRKIHADAFL